MLTAQKKKKGENSNSFELEQLIQHYELKQLKGCNLHVF